MKHALLAAAILSGALGLVISAPAASAQESAFPGSGSWSITSALPSGGGNIFGVWRMFGDRINVGFEVDYRDKEESDDGSSAFISSNSVTRDDLLVAGPSVRYYLKNEGPVAPYVRASVGWHRRDIELEQINSGDVVQNQQETSTIWRLAVGADWFPTKGVAFGFFTGIVSVDAENEIELGPGGSSGLITRKNDNFSTFKSGIEFQLFVF